MCSDKNAASSRRDPCVCCPGGPSDGTRCALVRPAEASHAALARQPRGMPDSRPQTRSRASSMSASSLRSQLRMALTFRTPMSEPSGELERPGSGKWSRDDRVPMDDERCAPHSKEDPDVTPPPTGPSHRRRAITPSPATGATRVPTLSNHTRTCNKLVAGGSIDTGSW